MAPDFVDYHLKVEETWIIKAIAIVAMLAHHLFYEHIEFGQMVVGIGRTGKVCVALFVFLSGYGMAISFPKSFLGGLNLARIHLFFVCRRYVKFFLNYWFVFFIFVPLGVFCFGRSLEAAYGEEVNLVKSFVSDMFGQQGFSSYNITWWFNAIILSLWLFFPLLYGILKKNVISFFFLLLLFINPFRFLDYLNFIGYGTARYFFTFALGVFVALHMNVIYKFLNLIQPIVVLCFSLVVLLVLLYLWNVPVFPEFTKFRVDPFASAFVALSVVCFCRVTKLRLPFIQYVGRSSLNMYMTHTFIFAYFFHDFVYGFKRPILIFLVLFTTSLLLSICIELVKRKIRFYKMQNCIVGVINRVGKITT